jgi:hypothetical protein
LKGRWLTFERWRDTFIFFMKCEIRDVTAIQSSSHGRSGGLCIAYATEMRFFNPDFCCGIPLLSSLISQFSQEFRYSIRIFEFSAFSFTGKRGTSFSVGQAFWPSLLPTNPVCCLAQIVL